MKHIPWIVSLVVVAGTLTGCGAKNQSAKVTAEQLQKSFQKADASVSAEVAQASTALKASNYTEAIIIMNRVVQAQPVNEAQKKAVDALIVQTRKAAQEDPKLNSPQLYQAISDLMDRVHGEN